MYGLNLLLLLMAAGASDLVFGSGIVTGIGQTETTGTKHASGHAIVSGTGTADVVGSKSAEGFGVVTGIGEPRAVSSEDFEGFGVVTGVGITEAAGVKHVSGHGIVDGIGEAIADGAKAVEASVEVIGFSDMDAAGIKASFQPVITTGIGLPVGVGSKSVSGFAEVAGIGRIVVDGFAGGAANRITVSGNLRVTVDGDRRAYVAEQTAGGHVVVTGIGTGDVEGVKHTEGFGVVSGVGVPVAEGNPPASGDYVDHFGISGIGTSKVATVNIGAAAADRSIVIFFEYPSHALITAATLGGEDLTVHDAVQMDGGTSGRTRTLALLSAPISTGTSAELNVTLSESTGFTNVIAFRALGLVHAEPTKSDIDPIISATSHTNTVDVLAGGIVLAAFFKFEGSSNNWGLTGGATEQMNDAVSSSQRRIAGRYLAETAVNDHDVTWERLSGSSSALFFAAAASFR